MKKTYHFLALVAMVFAPSLAQADGGNHGGPEPSKSKAPAPTPTATAPSSNQGSAGGGAMMGTIGMAGGGHNPFAGSMLGFSSAASVLSFDDNANLTYNPYYAQTLTISPRYRIAKWVSVLLNTGIGVELTNADGTTKKNEWLLTDTRLTAIFSPGTLPGGIGVSIPVGLQLPTSQNSRVRTLLFAANTGVTFYKRFSILHGLTLASTFNVKGFFHEYQTGEYDEAPFSCGTQNAASQAAYTHRSSPNDRCRADFPGQNPMNSMVAILSTSLSLTNWMWLSASGGVIRIAAYQAEGVGQTPLETTNLRHLATYSVGAGMSLMGVRANLTLDSTGLQLAPDTGRRAPFSRQNTTVILGISYDVGSLAFNTKEKS